MSTEVVVADQHDGVPVGVSEHPVPVVEVTVNGHRVVLPAGGLPGLQVRQEAVAQGAALQVGFDMWVRRAEEWSAVYAEDLVDVWDGQEYLAVTTDDHGPCLPGCQRWVPDLSTGGWSLVVAPDADLALIDHLLADDEVHAAVLLAEWTLLPDGRPSLVAGHQGLIRACTNDDYVEEGSGYRSLSTTFIRDAVLRARDEQLACLLVHNHTNAHEAGFSPVERASHERGYPALQAISGQPVGALVLTGATAVGQLWLPDGRRQALAELLVPDHPAFSLRLCPPATPEETACDE